MKIRRHVSSESRENTRNVEVTTRITLQISRGCYLVTVWGGNTNESAETGLLRA